MVRGTKPERWVRQTDFSNDEAVGFLADRLNRLGIEEKLVELGAVEGDAVLIGTGWSRVWDDRARFQGLVERLKNEAPRYAQLIPELPRLLHDALQRQAQPDATQEQLLRALLREQRRTNRLLTLGLGTVGGFVAGALFAYWLLPGLWAWLHHAF